MTATTTELRSAPRVSMELMIEELLNGFGTALEGVRAKRHGAQYVLASVCIALTR
jgi:hypothetical protein